MKKFIFLLILTINSALFCPEYSKFDIATSFVLAPILGVCGVVKYRKIQSFNEKLKNLSVKSESNSKTETKGYEKV